MDINKNLAIDRLFSLAVKNHKENNIKVAQNLYEKVLNMNPNFANAHNNLGIIYQSLGEKKNAINSFEMSIKINPNHTDSYYNLGSIFKELGEIKKAKKCYEKTIEINPNHIEAHNNLGVTFQTLEDYQNAKKCYEKAIEIDPSFFKAHHNLGITFQALEDYQNAKKCYEKAIEIDPSFFKAHNNLGVIFKELGETGKAKNSFEKTIIINPDYADGYNNLGVVFQESGEIEKAKSCFKKVININPDYGDAHSNLGVIFQELGENQEARDCYEKVIEIDPSHQIALYNLGLILFLGLQYKEAEKKFRLTNFKDSKSYLLNCLYMLGDKFTFFKELDNQINQGKTNPIIGSLIYRSEIKYGIKRSNPFCKDPFKYVLMTDLTDQYNFEDVFTKPIKKFLKDDYFFPRQQSLLTNGYQTAGNIFSIKNDLLNKIEDIIHLELDKYYDHYKKSKEGIIMNWPKAYNITAWLVSMKSGGKLAPHMHDHGWLSGSIYINVPPKLKTDSGNLVVCLDDQESKKNENINQKKEIDVSTGSLCLFPSSLYHYTIPFESKEDRIVVAFDMIPKKLSIN